MITANNLVDVLTTLGFEKIDNVCEKYFPNLDCKIRVDPILKRIQYPFATVGFDHNENFVVLECITRLMSKGYRAEHIELEKKWKLGHGASGGRSDICVRNFDNNQTLFIIECKTAGAEYDAALEQMKRDGGQLFSYWQQTRECKWLILYAADFVDGEIKHSVETIDCSEAAYRRASKTEELFRVWKKTFEQKLCGDVIFSENSAAYRINEPPLLKKNLVDFEEKNRIINKFEEILRHNNVSDKENAFNRLTALFISKLADESSKAENAEVEFQYKIGTDTFESLQDRLQRLYSEGMKQFMREHIFYVGNDYVEKVLNGYMGQSRQKLIDELNQTVRRLKFFTNNEFAFKEIHNEKLFRQNGKILVEVVRLFERYRIIGAKNLQLLGDLFEQLLNHGFKQNEGQFFTPIPLTRFIWDCLPLNQKIRAEDGKVIYPRIIDYACGAGHFLTQGFEAVNDCVRRNFDTEPDPKWVGSKLYGIEKDYRLSRVSKIALFMHGAGLGNVVFGDGLDDHVNFDFGKEILPGRFDILTANPPYAVAAFKPHLAEETQKHFSILDKISDDGSEIETLFVERAAQLLKPLGVAALILPSSLLNKDTGSFIAARSILLRRFKIRAIVQLGSKTFGATGTQTAIFFLQKFDEPLRRELAVEDSVDAIFDWREKLFAEWEDKSIIDAWLAKLDISAEDYKAFVKRTAHFDDWKDHSHFGKYHAAFVESGGYIRKLAQPSFQKMSTTEQSAELDLMFYEFAHPIERDKLLTFGCTYNQTTLIVTAPDENKAQEKFLGYKWSNRKGAEGMQTIKAGGMLFDPKDHSADGTIAAMVRAAFNDEELYFEELKDYCYYLPTHEMLDFGGSDFKKSITTKPKTLDVERKFPIVRLGEVIDINQRTFNPETTPTKQYHYVDIASINENSIDYSKLVVGSEAPTRARRLATENDVLISTVRPYLKSFAIVQNMPPDTLFSTGFAILSTRDDNVLINEFVYRLFMHDPLLMDQIRAKMGKALYPSINQTDIRGFIIPLPSIEIQREIVAAFEAIEEKLRAEDRIILDCDAKIDAAYDALVGSIREVKTASPETLFDSIETGSRPAGGVHVFNDGVYSLGGEHIGTDGRLNLSKMKFVPKKFYAEAKTGRIGKNDILMCKDGALSGKVAIVRDELDGADAMANEHVFVMRNGDIDRQWYLFCFLYSRDGQRQLQASVTGMTQGGINRTNLGRIQIPLPPIDRQREFSSLVRALDAEKTAARNRRRELQSERDAIINRYFKK